MLWTKDRFLANLLQRFKFPIEIGYFMGHWGFREEFSRKLMHLLAGAVIIAHAFLSQTFDEKAALLVLSAVLIVLLELEYIRIELRQKISFLSFWWDLKREKEKNALGSDAFFLLGAIICFAAFDYKIAIIALLMTIFGDMAAALIGTRFGKHWIPKIKDKSWEGALAELAVNIIVGIVIANLFSIPNAIAITIIMALTATFIETIAHKIDDNLLIPIFSGFNGQIALLLLGVL